MPPLTVVDYLTQPGLWATTAVLTVVAVLVIVQLRRYRPSTDDYPPICTCLDDWCDWYDRTRDLTSLTDDEWNYYLSRPVCRACMAAAPEAGCCRSYLYL